MEKCYTRFAGYFITTDNVNELVVKKSFIPKVSKCNASKPRDVCFGEVIQPDFLLRVSLSYNCFAHIVLRYSTLITEEPYFTRNSIAH